MKKELITYFDPKSPVSEMFKTLRTNIQFMGSNKVLKTLLVTSTVPEEGKSWTSANLAITFAQTGKNVLLIDADMRKGRQFNVFGLRPTPGLSNYLSGVLDGEQKSKYELQDFIQTTEVENLYVMTAGNVPPNPAELLISEKMLELINIVRENFDITIFDGTPSLLVTDASVLSRIVDSTILVTACNKTKIDDLAKTKKSIENVGGKVAGVVLNKIPISTKKYESTYYYGSNSMSVKKTDNKRESIQREINKYTQKDNELKLSEEKNQEVRSYNYQAKQTQEQPIVKNTQENYNSTWKTENYDKVEEPILSWEKETKKVPEGNQEISIDKTKDILKQVEEYLAEEKAKLKNGDN